MLGEYIEKNKKTDETEYYLKLRSKNYKQLNSDNLEKTADELFPVFYNKKLPLIVSYRDIYYEILKNRNIATEIVLKIYEIINILEAQEKKHINNENFTLNTIPENVFKKEKGNDQVIKMMIGIPNKKHVGINEDYIKYIKKMTELINIIIENVNKIYKKNIKSMKKFETISNIPKNYVNINKWNKDTIKLLLNAEQEMEDYVKDTEHYYNKINKKLELILHEIKTT